MPMIGPSRGGAQTALRFAGTLVVAALAALAGAQEAQEVAVRESINTGLGTVPPRVARSSPAASWRSFLSLGEAGDLTEAAHLLDLSEVPVEQQGEVGPEISGKLYEVLRELGASIEQVTSDTPEGTMRGDSPLNVVVALTFQRPTIAGEVWLRRTEDRTTGELAWLFTRQTVSNVRLWYEILIEGARIGTVGELNLGLGPVPLSIRRSTPRQCLTGFVAAARRGAFGEAAHYLDLDGFSTEHQAEQGERLARRLMLVMQRHLWINPQLVSNDPAGAPQAGVAIDQQRIASAEFKGQQTDVVLRRQAAVGAGLVWTFAPDFVAQIDRLYKDYGYGWLGDHLPTAFFSVTVLGLQLWQWSALLLIVSLGWGVARLLGHLIVVGAMAVTRKTAVTWDDEIVKALDGPLGFIVWGLVFAVFSPLVGLSPGAQAISTMIWKLLLLTGVGWLLFRAVDGIARQLRETATERNILVLTFVPIIQRIGKFLTCFLLILAALDVIGVNVVAALAGLGLGGLAVAFAAQKTLENIFGALAIAGDRPFKIGDFVQVAGVMGNVEDVGLRSTRIRTLQRTLVSIPNSAVVNDTITNFAARDRMFFNPTLGVVYGTTAAQLTYIVDEVRRMLLEDPRVYLDAQRTRFKAFGAFSLDIEVVAWILTADYNEYTAIAEDLNFRIMEIVERSGSTFAFPSQTLYLGRDGGLDAGRATAIATEVESRRASGELVVPEPTKEQLAVFAAARIRESEE